MHAHIAVVYGNISNALWALLAMPMPKFSLALRPCHTYHITLILKILKWKDSGINERMDVCMLLKIYPTYTYVVLFCSFMRLD